MQLNITTDYGIRILLYLAITNDITSSSELSENLKVSRDYVYTIGRKLRKAGYIQTVAGVTGGFVLQKRPSEITLHDILLLFEGSIKINRCLMEDGYCSRNATPTCMVHKVYSEIQDEFERELKSHTIESIMIDQKKVAV